MTQPELPFAANEPTVNTLNAWVLEFLREFQWNMPHELCSLVCCRHHVIVSDSSITARLRDLRKPRYGAHVIEKRRRANSSAYEYRLGDK
jgi:hypothetical protein